MAIAPSRRPRFFAGLVLLGCWLGWITATFAAIGTRAQADADVAATTLQQLAGQIPAGFRGTPLAIRLQDGHCTCAAAEQQWQRLQTQLDAMAGHTLSLPAADRGHGMPELLVLAGNGTAVYAGPMLPAADRCGAPPDALTQWLPALLSADATPLLLPSRCSC